MNDEMPQGKKTVSDSEILDAIENHEHPFVGARELADEFKHTRQWAHSRLQSLYDRGLIEKKEAGKRSVIWWPASD